MCLYDYTPYIGCNEGEQHFYLQWMKCNKAADKNEYCPLEKSVPVEELRDFSGNVLCCPIHRHIVVQQHQFVFVQGGGDSVPALGAVTNLIDLDETTTAKDVIQKQDDNAEPRIREVEIEIGPQSPGLEQTLQSPRLALAPKSPRLKEDKPVSPGPNVEEYTDFGEELRREARKKRPSGSVSLTSSMEAEPPAAPPIRPKAAARKAVEDMHRDKRASIAHVSSHRRTRSREMGRGHRRTGSLQETSTYKGKDLDEPLPDTETVRVGKRSPPPPNFDDLLVPEDVDVGLPARPDIHRRPSIASRSGDGPKVEKRQPRNPADGPSADLPEPPVSPRRMPRQPKPGVPIKPSYKAVEEHRRDIGDDEDGRDGRGRHGRPGRRTRTASPDRDTEQDDDPDQDEGLEIRPRRRGDLNRSSRRDRSHSSDHHRARSRSESTGSRATRSHGRHTQPLRESSARRALATQTHWSEELVRRNTENRGYVHQVPPSRKWSSPGAGSGPEPTPEMQERESPTLGLAVRFDLPHTPPVPVTSRPPGPGHMKRESGDSGYQSSHQRKASQELSPAVNKSSLKQSSPAINFAQTPGTAATTSTVWKPEYQTQGNVVVSAGSGPTKRLVMMPAPLQHHYPMVVSKLAPRPLPDAAYLPVPEQKGVSAKRSLGRLKRSLSGLWEKDGRKPQGASLS